MRRIETSLIIDRSPKEVWECVANPLTWPMWASSYLELKQTASGPIAVGATLQSKHPRSRELAERVIELEPNHSFALEFTSGPIRGSRVSFRTEEATAPGSAARTRLTRLFDLKFSGLFRVFGPLLIAPGFRRESYAEVNKLKQLLEGTGIARA